MSRPHAITDAELESVYTDGEIDARKITEHKHDARPHLVRPEECAHWRRRIERMNSRLKDVYDVRVGRRGEKTVYAHATGSCRCEHDTPPLEHTTGNQDGEWMFVDE